MRDPGNRDMTATGAAGSEPVTRRGLAVGVVRNGRLDFFDGHGFAEIGSGTTVGQETVFRVGPLTKTFTAVSVM